MNTMQNAKNLEGKKTTGNSQLERNSEAECKNTHLRGQVNWSTPEEYSDYTESTSTLDYDDALPCSMQDVRNFTKTFLPVAYSLISVFGLVGNVLVVITFAFYKKVKSMTDVYLFNMAITDILFVLTLPFWAVNHATGSWIFSNFICKLTSGIYAINFNCGMLFLACISMDRYVAIVQATKSLRLRAKSFKFRMRTLAYSKVICSVIWMFSIIISGATFVFSQRYQMQGKYICEPKYQVVSEAITWKLLILGLQLLFGFFIPLLFMIFCYTFIVKALVEAQNSKRRQVIRVIIAVVVTFLVFQVPYNMVLLLNAANLGKLNRTCKSEQQRAYARNITQVLAFLHCCLNPVLYAFIGQNFRNYFVKIMKDLWCVDRKPKPGTPSCPRKYSDTCISRQTSEIADSDNASSFTM
ncbi:C-C chemokine receptor type 6 [Tachyglossus aculeatus]|uniref:C-C chemokine receptor type 6 n=1 Tax=Tachyglossus aculeatus TaxID=9261 RepID=UPI0018F4B4E9|nr:C-C chemokine receptor type 6 [Tachyglossus aculeatus]